jgi:hypothetical protein
MKTFHTPLFIFLSAIFLSAIFLSAIFLSAIFLSAIFLSAIFLSNRWSLLSLHYLDSITQRSVNESDPAT